ncbi:ABC transporter ATP-binding protein [Saxibacter everestensis]|uniref:ABC transporter ATP-binding protein n=1 Tax=Saxibacter everestensis TaxID=2909229 RepID=A0ABY8QXD0_9MICO|nr:ABC transporter ATP-binding protein [Brevibacteriaceae bacterium ZFBP1038]
MSVVEAPVAADRRTPARTGPSVKALLRFWPDVRPFKWHFIGSITFSVLATLTGLVIPLVTQHIIDGPIAHGDFGGIWLPAALVLLLGLIDAAGVWARRIIIARPSSELEVNLRAKLFRKLQAISVGEHDGWDSGQLLSRAIQDMSTIRRFTAFAMPFMIINSVTVVAGLTVLTVLHWEFGLVVFLASIPLFLICVQFENKYKVVSRRAQDQTGDVATTVEESVQGIRVLKAFGRSAHLGMTFIRQSRQVRTSELLKVRYDAVLWSSVIGIPAIAIGLILGIGTWSIARGDLTPGTLVAAITMATFLRWPVESFGFLLAEANNAATAADRYWEIIDTPVSITDRPGAQPLEEPIRGRLSFNRMSFAFPDADRDQLHDVTLSIEPGETVALVGATGSGKTALTNLVPRLYDVTAGAICIDGTDIRDIPVEQLRSLVTVAFEEPVLFSASVRENVALGQPDATLAEIREALDIAQASGFVDELPWGLDTRIGEQGLSLSGGQRQRLALARAVLGKPRIMVLDDPLSALDVNTEEKVQAELRRVLPDSTTLLVAHRPSTASLADRVALLDEGTIVATGTHEHLLETSARYRYVMGSIDV